MRSHSFLLLVLFLVPTAAASTTQITGPAALLGTGDFDGVVLWEGGRIESFLTAHPAANDSTKTAIHYNLTPGSPAQVLLVTDRPFPSEGNISAGRLNATIDLPDDWSPIALVDAVSLNVTRVLGQTPQERIGTRERAPLFIVIEDPSAHESHPLFRGTTTRGFFGGHHAEYAALTDLRMTVVWCSPEACGAVNRAAHLAANRAAAYEFNSYRWLLYQHERMMEVRRAVADALHEDDLVRARRVVEDARAGWTQVEDPWHEIRSSASGDAGIPSPFLEMIEIYRSALEDLERQAEASARDWLDGLLVPIDGRAASVQIKQASWLARLTAAMTFVSLVMSCCSLGAMARERRARLRAERELRKEQERMVAAMGALLRRLRSRGPK